MAWYDRSRRSDNASPAQFADVGTPERRLPSWLAKDANSVQSPQRPLPAPPPHPGISARPLAVGLRVSPNLPEGERLRGLSERPASVRPASRRPSRPTNSRSSMSPSDLEAIISERAAQRVHFELLETGRSALGEAIEALDQARRDLLYGAEPRLIELSILIAKRIIARELRTQPELVADLVREGLDALASRDKVRVKLGTGFSMMSVMISEQLAARGIGVDLSIAPNLSEFGCVVETDIGRVDESVEARIAALLEAIDTEEDG